MLYLESWDVRAKKRADRAFAREKPEECQRIKDYLQGAVDAWCNENKDDRAAAFSAASFFGGVRAHNWRGTPLAALYTYYSEKGAPHPHKTAGTELGFILYQVLWEHPWAFLQQKETRIAAQPGRETISVYQWKGPEPSETQE